MAGAEETGGGLMVPCADAASRAENLAQKEPILVRALDDLDGECPKPPSPRFPVWKPRHMDGGVFPFNERRMRGGSNPR